ncbi:four helix bundle protein [Mangrovibacterium marinum]|uniref:Four helix bundle protein n=1 Tax=Mangrovibacterium marinum TaxID=1639118 RepID=A0A2T5C4W8_9BACT|nr:four helix bundle protein [Mangrovibacterium marinum]PTN09912.1 four helix bundle protein [Mangrovibacterium marinum]
MDFKELLAYQKAFSLSMQIFQLSKRFPKEETYSLTDQVRRSSRSVCANIAEAYRKRIYVRHFISKLTDSDGENSETAVWLDFALACDYISAKQHEEMFDETKEVGRLINYMIQHPGKFGCNEKES